jgi:hypothetical protein
MFATMLLLSYGVISSFGITQSPGPPSWDILANESSVVVVGVREKELVVVRRDKMVSNVKPLPNGNKIIEIPNPNDYVVGHIIQIRVQEILKSDGKVKAKGIVNVYVPGYAILDGMPSFVEKERYLIFLSPLKTDNQTFKGTTIFQPDPSAKDQSFNPSSKYIVVWGDGGAVNLAKPRNSNAINEVKAALNKPR